MIMNNALTSAHHTQSISLHKKEYITAMHNVQYTALLYHVLY